MTIKTRVPQMLALGVGLLLPIGAQAATICEVSIPEQVGWGGTPGSWTGCDCGDISGSIAMRNDGRGWYGSDGEPGGEVWVQLEMSLVGQSNVTSWSWAIKANDGQYFVMTGHTEGGQNFQTSEPDWSWTGRYRVVCAH